MNGFFSKRISFLIVLTVMVFSGFLFSEENDNAFVPEIDPASYVGFTLEMINDRLGMPVSVYAVRGDEAWQDDVVFMYPDIELYIFKDRVWQISPASAYNMEIGDSIEQVKSIMGEPLVATEQFLLYRLPSQAWPVMFRINLNQEKKAASFYIYRADF